MKLARGSSGYASSMNFHLAMNFLLNIKPHGNGIVAEFFLRVAFRDKIVNKE